MEPSAIKQLMNDYGCCVIIPTYNNANTIASVIESVLLYASDVFVVNDGATDNTPSVIENYRDKVSIVSYEINRGKAYALHQGFLAAYKAGFKYAITIDSDGQHFAKDIELFANKLNQGDRIVWVGSRFLNQENMPRKNTFANKFSNFWFALQTLNRLPDTQSGYRLYPLAHVAKINLLGYRYEGELELLVRLAWKGVRAKSAPISVYYAPDGERVSHFRPTKDFFRISVLNTFLTTLAFIYGYPSMLYHSIKASLCRR